MGDIVEDVTYSLLELAEQVDRCPADSVIFQGKFRFWKITIFVYKQPRPQASSCHMEMCRPELLCLLLAMYMLEKCCCVQHVR